MRWSKTQRLLVAAVWVGVGLSAMLSARPGRAATRVVHAPILPPGFVQTVAVEGLDRPTDMAILPAGDLLVVEKGSGAGQLGKSAVRLVRQGALQPEPVITLNTTVEANSGILAVTVDPNFADNGFFYLFYTTGEKSLQWSGQPTGRLARLTLDLAAGRADPASERILLEGVTWDVWHNGAGLVFDNQGNLLLSTGDASSGPDFARNLSQQPDSLNGKVLRIHPRPDGGYDIPPDNPYVGMTGADAPRPEIYGWGLRNPFRMTKRAADGAIFLIDVGQDTWEEINLVLPGANYGWPMREGPCAVFELTNCTPTPAGFTNPIVTYPHPEGRGAGLTAVTYYAGSQFPSEYRRHLFYFDFDGLWLGAVNPDNVGATQRQVASGFDLVTDMESTDQGIYLVALLSGRIYYLYHSGNANQPPVPQVQAEPVQGSAPLTVTFSTAGTTDADDPVLDYVWDFGLGSAAVVTRTQTVQAVYPQNGIYTATVTVRDVRGAAAAPVRIPIQVYSGEMAKIVAANRTTPGRTLYHGGDSWRFTAQRTGGTTGLDAAQPYLWTVLQHHNDHIHPVVADYAAAALDFDIGAESHALDPTIWYEVILIMRAATGQRLEFVKALRPEVAQLLLAYSPGAGNRLITVNQRPQPLGEPLDVIVGQTYRLVAPALLLYGETVGEFDHWSVTSGSPSAALTLPDREIVITAAANSQTYTAHYRDLRRADRVLLPLVPSVTEEKR